MSTKLGSGNDSTWKPEALLQNWRKVLGGTLLVVLGVSFLHGWAETFLERQEQQAPEVRQFGSGTESLQGETWLEPLPVRIRKPVYWRFSLRNPLSQPVRVSLERLEATDLLIPKGGSDGLIRTEEKSAGVSWQDWETEMAPGGDASFWIKWESPQPVGIHRLSATLSWETLTEPATSGTVKAALEDIQVVAPGRTFIAHVVRCFVTLLGILAVPMVIAIAGFGFQQRQQTLVQERQAWANMLPTSHKNNNNYYIPLLSAIKAFRFRRDEKVEVLKKPFEQANKKDAAPAVLAYHLLFILRKLRVITQAGVGFHLQDRLGEKIVSTCFDNFFADISKQLKPYPRVSALLDRMTAKESLSEHLKKGAALRWKEKKELEAVQRQIWRWLQDRNQCWSLHWLFLGHSFLKFEINRIYQFWYGDPPAFPEEEVNEQLQGLKERLAPSAERKEVLDLEKFESWIATYLEATVQAPKARHR